MDADERLVRSFYRALETGDSASLSALLDPAWEELPPVYPGQPLGADGYLPVVAGFRAAFPDVRFEIHEVIAAPPKFTVRTTIHGTHQGPFAGREASGRKVAFGTIDVHEVEGARIRRSWHIEDIAGFQAQVDG